MKTDDIVKRINESAKDVLLNSIEYINEYTE